MSYRTIITGIVLALSLPLLTAAAGNKYFEFAPDTDLTISLSDVNTPSQTVYPQNDFISGFDLWFDNSGEAGSATLTLKNAAGNILSSKTATLPKANPVWSGNLFHVDLQNTIAVSSTAPYKISITSAMPNLRLYYGNKIRILESNSPYPPPENVLGATQLGTAPQNFYFKIALYEDNDTDPPIISNASSSLFSPSTLAISFNANEPVDYMILLTQSPGGTSETYNWSGSYAFCNQGIKTCQASFEIQPETSYAYKITALDYTQNKSELSGTIDIPSNPVVEESGGANPEENTTPPPVISGAKIVSVTDQSVTATWQTDLAATSIMIVSLDPMGANIIASLNDQTMEFFHTMTITGDLLPQTNYFAALVSSLPTGQSASQVVGFTTLVSTAPQNTTSTTSTTSTTQTNTTQTQTNTSNITNNSTSSSNITHIDTTQVPANQVTGASAALPEPTITIVTAADGSQILEIEWKAPSYGEPNRGYQIDILDAENRLAERIVVEAGIHKIQIKTLPVGNYHLLIYANQDGVLTRIARVLVVQMPKGKTTPWSLFFNFLGTPAFYGLAVLLTIIGGIAAFYAFKLKKV